MLAASGLALLASLYLPWEEASLGPRGSLLNLLPIHTLDGWSSGVADAAALADLILVGIAVAAFLRPRVARRFPLTWSALLAFYLAVAVGADVRSTADRDALLEKSLHFHYAYGAYLGIAAASVALIAGIARWETPNLGRATTRRSVCRVSVSLLVCGLLVALLLPWQRYAPLDITYRGIASPSAVAAAALALWLLVRWWSQPSKAGERLVLSASTALFAGAAFSSVTTPASRQYGAWIGLGCALASLALAVVDGAPWPRGVRPPLLGLATAAAAGLLIASFFLPWQWYCYPRGRGFDGLSGQCVAADGWSTLGTVSGLLGIALVLAVVARRIVVFSVREIVGVMSMLVAAAGFELVDSRSAEMTFRFGYGSTVGFYAAAVLVALASFGLRPPSLMRVRVLPIAVCVAYLAVVMLPWWQVLSQDGESALRFADPSWLTIAGVLIAVRLIRCWSTRAAVRPSALVVGLPVALLVLAGVDLIRARDEGVSWGGGAVVVLSFLLILVGLIERDRGLETWRLPEALRVDRI